MKNINNTTRHTRTPFDIRAFGIFSLRSKCLRRFERGFTLIELLIVMGIVAMLAGMSLTSVTRSRTQNAVRQASQELAQALREAEANALAVKGFTFEGETTFPAYGVYFVNPAAASGRSVTEYFPFVDVDGDGVFSGGDVKNGPARKLPQGAVMRKYVEDPESVFIDRDLSIVFTRPTPIVSFSSGGLELLDRGYVGVCVEATDTSLSRIIRVWRSGHISVSDFSTECNFAS